MRIYSLRSVADQRLLVLVGRSVGRQSFQAVNLRLTDWSGKWGVTDDAWTPWTLQAPRAQRPTTDGNSRSVRRSYWDCHTTPHHTLVYSHVWHFGELETLSDKISRPKPIRGIMLSSRPVWPFRRCVLCWHCLTSMATLYHHRPCLFSLAVRPPTCHNITTHNVDLITSKLSQSTTSH